MTTFAERLDALPTVMPMPPDTASDADFQNYLLSNYTALEARLCIAMELLEEVTNAGVVQSLRKYEELQVYPELRADARALVAKVRGELGA